MNQATTRQYDEFVFRRLTEPFPAVGNHLEPRGNTILWLAVLFTILFVGLIYVGIMYLRDSRGVGIIWAGLLGLLRLGVYAAIAFVFLLPSKQSYEETSASSRVIVLFDVSESMTTRDDIPRPGQNFDELPTRGKKLQDFLEDARIDFFGNLNKKNPAVVYRFSAGLDGSPVYFDTDGRTYTKEEYTELEEKRKQPGFQKETEKRPLGHDYLTHFINPITDPNAKPVALPDDLNSNDKDRFEKLIAHNRKLAQNRVFSGTNVGDATLNTLTREVNNMAQGIVIFTDGRSTEGTDAAYEQIAKLAKQVGEHSDLRRRHRLRPPAGAHRHHRLPRAAAGAAGRQVPRRRRNPGRRLGRQGVRPRTAHRLLAQERRRQGRTLQDLHHGARR